ncbi:hypothetical protein ILYODFUR_018261 [Ilyodon furcidens]|uniref:Uncharacterized protein n=1 Tax=Ilyodon furcidens TaxID=33524 RepID=A0ABV0UL53_9TELE
MGQKGAALMRQSSTQNRLHWSRDPRPQGTSLPKQRPDRARGPRPRQAAAGSEPAHTKAPSFGQREPPIHQQAETPATSREETAPTFDGGSKLIQEREQRRLHPLPKTLHPASRIHTLKERAPAMRATIN